MRQLSRSVTTRGEWRVCAWKKGQTRLPAVDIFAKAYPSRNNERTHRTNHTCRLRYIVSFFSHPFSPNARESSRISTLERENAYMYIVCGKSLAGRRDARVEGARGEARQLRAPVTKRERVDGPRELRAMMMMTQRRSRPPASCVLRCVVKAFFFQRESRDECFASVESAEGR